MKDIADIIPCVIDVVQQVFFDEQHALTETTYLPALAGFDSIQIITILETLEARLDIEADPGLLLPGAFDTPLSIAELFVKSQHYTEAQNKLR